MPMHAFLTRTASCWTLGERTCPDAIQYIAETGTNASGTRTSGAGPGKVFISQLSPLQEKGIRCELVVMVTLMLVGARQNQQAPMTTPASQRAENTMIRQDPMGGRSAEAYGEMI